MTSNIDTFNTRVIAKMDQLQANLEELERQREVGATHKETRSTANTLWRLATDDLGRITSDLTIADLTTVLGSLEVRVPKGTKDAKIRKVVDGVMKVHPAARVHERIESAYYAARRRLSDLAGLDALLTEYSALVPEDQAMRYAGRIYTSRESMLAMIGLQYLRLRDGHTYPPTSYNDTETVVEPHGVEGALTRVGQSLLYELLGGEYGSINMVNQIRLQSLHEYLVQEAVRKQLCSLILSVVSNGGESTVPINFRDRNGSDDGLHPKGTGSGFYFRLYDVDFDTDSVDF